MARNPRAKKKAGSARGPNNTKSTTANAARKRNERLTLVKRKVAIKEASSENNW